MLAADEVVAAAAARGVPVLAALALADGIPADHDVPAAGELPADLLVVAEGLAVGRVAAGDEDGGLGSARGIGHVDERGHVQAGQALEDDLLDPVPVHGNGPGDPRVQRRLRLGQAADHVEHARAHLLAQGEEVGFGADLREGGPARLVLGPGAVELIAQVRA